ncbi:MAG: 30S ribosome-binding factor RbfA [Clostridiales bacterium]|nr:30S ribosome-binding factor RbfA [Candidatus Crickella merdequi]
MARHRQGRLGEEIKKSISSILINGVKDPRLANRIITISGVDVTSDGSYAYVYVTPLVLGNEDKDKVCEEVLAGFNKAKGLLRNRVASDIKLRHTPELVFRIDSSMDYGRHIDSLLAEIKENTPDRSEEE